MDAQDTGVKLNRDKFLEIKGLRKGRANTMDQIETDPCLIKWE